MPGQSPLPPPVLPPRPQCRPAPPRKETLCFWIILLLFLAGLGYLALLASTNDTGPMLTYSAPGVIGTLLAIAAIAAVIAGIACNHQKHRHR
jgi:polyferredoxin